MRTHQFLLIFPTTLLIRYYSVTTNAFVIQQQPAGQVIRSSLLSPIAFQLHSSALLDQNDANQEAATTTNTNNKTAVSWDWEAVATAVFQDDKRPIILFDGQCNLCNGGVNFAIDYDPNAKFRFASLHTRVGKSLLIRSGREPDDLSSIVVCFPDGKAYVDSEAVLMIAQGLATPISVVGTVGRVIPAPLRDAIYEYVSKNRYKFAGEYDSCRLDFEGEYDDRFVSDPDL